MIQHTVLYSCVFPAFWQHFDEEQHTAVLVMCLQTFGHTTNIEKSKNLKAPKRVTCTVTSVICLPLWTAL